jgi:type II secretory pathway pseudopilin PulG
MTYRQTPQGKARSFAQYAAIVAAILLTGSACSAQTAQAGQQPQVSWAPDENKYPGLTAEFGTLFTKIQNNVQFPAPRSEGRLLPLLPPSTTFCAAFPNYGDVSTQILDALHEELQKNAVFRDWWQHGDMAATGPKVEDFLKKFSELHQYLGEEIVLSGSTEGKDPSLVIVAEVRKPGLKKVLQQMAEQLAGNSKPSTQILEQQELAAATDKGLPQQPVVLIRPDFVVLATNLATLRSFNDRLDRPSREFASAPFGQRVMREYPGGVAILGAADLQKILSKAVQASPDAKQSAAFQQSGFADLKYLVWDNRQVAGKSLSQMELSFSGPRRGAASWLAKSSPLGSLDFVSPGAVVAATLVLASPGRVFDGLKDLVSISNPNAFAALPAFEQGLRLSLKDDLLNLLGGEITFELDNAAPPQPAWKAMLAVKDANRLQQTLNTLVTAVNLKSERSEEGGITHYSVRIPNPKGTVEIHYAFTGGYLILGSSKDAVAKAIELHRSGGSLAKSQKLLAQVPPGHSLEASAMIYQDPLAMTALRLRQAAPQLADSLARNRVATTPVAAWFYGEDTAIREASSSPALDVGVVLVAAAIAIPNLMRSKIAANEASAAGTLRTVNTAQVVYKTAYPQRGYAASLSTLGPAPSGPGPGSPDHANLLDESLANENCSADAWCTKSGFRFKIAAVCAQRRCQEYVVFATPVDANTGSRSFCSTSDGVIRSKVGPPCAGPFTAPECKAWPPVQ